MSLMKLLSVSKSFAGGRNLPGRYKMSEQGLLPKFAPIGRTVSLTPMHHSDDPGPKRGTHRAPTPSPELLQQEFLRPTEPVTEPVQPVAPSPRAVECLNAIPAPTNWFRLGNNPFGNRAVAKPKLLTTAQAELSLDAVKPVRNDLSDSDLQIVPAKPNALKPTHPNTLRPELTGLAWSRLTARFFNSERVRA